MTEEWKEFEKLAAKIQQDLAPDAVVEHNVTLRGTSGVDNQCDALIKAKAGQYEFLVILECKNWKDKIGVAVVREFESKVRDVGAHKGAIIAKYGFTSDALEYAKSKGISVYTLINSEDIRWQQEPLIPVVVIKVYLGTAMIYTLNRETKENIGLTMPDGSRTSEDHSYLFDNKNNKYINFREFLEKQWDMHCSRKDLSSGNLITADSDRYSLYVKPSELIPVNVQYILNAVEEYHYGYLSLTQSLGFLDEHTREVRANSWETEPLIFKEAIDKWPFVNNHEELPFKTPHNFRVIFYFSPRPTDPPEAIVIGMGR
jgi:hypothetical protein